MRSKSGELDCLGCDHNLLSYCHANDGEFAITLAIRNRNASVLLSGDAETGHATGVREGQARLRTSRRYAQFHGPRLQDPARGYVVSHHRGVEESKRRDDGLAQVTRWAVTAGRSPKDTASRLSAEELVRRP